MAEAAPQDGLECLQPSKKNELALWKVSKKKNESDKQRLSVIMSNVNTAGAVVVRV